MKVYLAALYYPYEGETNISLHKSPINAVRACYRDRRVIEPESLEKTLETLGEAEKALEALNEGKYEKYIITEMDLEDKKEIVAARNCLKTLRQCDIYKSDGNNKLPLHRSRTRLPIRHENLKNG
jgi:hypothetical protein